MGLILQDYNVKVTYTKGEHQLADARHERQACKSDSCCML